MNHDSQLAYWNSVAPSKTFSHEIDVERFEALVPKSSPVLDVGCGYGRMASQLIDRGYERVAGLDSSVAMIARAEAECPEADFRITRNGRLAVPNETVDAVLLLAVLTCIPQGDDQRQMIREVQRVLRPGGYLFVTDLWLQAGPDHTARYESSRPKGAPRGVFEHEEGAVFRHHTEEWVDELMGPFTDGTREDITFRSMNGNPTHGFRFIGRRG